jgi:hypothetical protein
MDIATCQCGCGQDWMVMPSDLESSFAPECQERERKRRVKAEREQRKALRQAHKLGR